MASENSGTTAFHSWKSGLSKQDTLAYLQRLIWEIRLTGQIEPFSGPLITNGWYSSAYVGRRDYPAGCLLAELVLIVILLQAASHTNQDP